ncbi:MAG: hypothetical protein JXB03_08655 [Spirochaetales bacterium]|nr:hypothetical protein [Spirochaetales bacterium]
MLTQLGKPAVHLTHAGGSQKSYFCSLCKLDHIPLVYANSRSEIRTCTTAVDITRHTVTELIEEATPVAAGTERNIRRLFRRLLKKCSTVIISGTKADGYDESLYPWMTALAREQGVPVVLDIKGADLIRSLPYGPSWIKPNMAEFIATFGIPGPNEEEEIPAQVAAAAIEKAIQISRSYQTGCILTRGKLGAEVIHGSFHEHIDAPAMQAVNTTGCGDAFTAGFASLLPKEKSRQSLRAALDTAIDCAAKNACTKTPGSLL